MRWTTDLPTAPGYYWLAYPGRQPVPASVADPGSGLRVYLTGDAEGWPLSDCTPGVRWCRAQPPPGWEVRP